MMLIKTNGLQIMWKHNNVGCEGENISNPESQISCNAWSMADGLDSCTKFCLHYSERTFESWSTDFVDNSIRLSGSVEKDFQVDIQPGQQGFL
jgi:hypothetical protein